MIARQYLFLCMSLFVCLSVNAISRTISTISELETIIKPSTGLVIVKFWMPGCGPCSKMTPIVDSLARSHTECTFAACNIMQAKGIAERYHINSVPTIIIFKNGDICWRHTGTISQLDLDHVIASLY